MTAILERLRGQGSDDDCEAKSAARGFPDSVAETLSSFANKPGGGIILLGVDESAGFAATGVYDVGACRRALTDMARQALEPHVTVVTDVVMVDQAAVVVANVREASPDEKPVRVRRSGRAYLRHFDGDYPMSEQEVQQFIAQRGLTRWDMQPVDGASREDLDAALVSTFLNTCRNSTCTLAGAPDDVALVRTGVTTSGGVPTAAGILALGVYPQQFFPHSAIQASVENGEGAAVGIRAVDSRSIDGPIPLMLSEALAWVRRNTSATILVSQEGRARDRAAYPPVAVRELVANALLHRDLSPHARSSPITVKIDQAGLVIANAGGLFGISVERLGTTTSHCRNAHLVQILTRVTTDDGARVVERLGSGIPAARQALREASMAPPQFYDQGIRFTVRLRPETSLPRSTAAASATAHGQLILDTLGAASLTLRDVCSATGLSSRQARFALVKLRDGGMVLQHGSKGSTVTYVRA